MKKSIFGIVIKLICLLIVGSGIFIVAIKPDEDKPNIEKPVENKPIVIKPEEKKAQMESCIYMLNEIYMDEYSVEYYDTSNEMKKAIYASEEEYNNGGEMTLIGNSVKAPKNSFSDPLGKVYYPVYSMKSVKELTNHVSEYFSKDFMKEIEKNIKVNFVDYNNNLYLVRGGMGYGVYAVNFDTVDYSNEKENLVYIERLMNNELDKKVKINFVIEDGKYKINSDEFIIK